MEPTPERKPGMVKRHWSRVAYRAAVESAEMIGLTSKARFGIAVFVFCAATFALGALFGKEGREQALWDSIGLVLTGSFTLVALIGVFLFKLISVPAAMQSEQADATRRAEVERDDALRQFQESAKPDWPLMLALRYIRNLSDFGISRKQEGDNWLTSPVVTVFELYAQQGLINVWGKPTNLADHKEIPMTYWINAQIDRNHLFMNDHGQLGGYELRTEMKQHLVGSIIYEQLRVSSVEISRKWPTP